LSPVRVGRALAATASFCAVVVGLVFVLLPALKPEAPPATKAARLDDVTVDRNVTFGEYLDRTAQKRFPFQAPQLRRSGVLIGFAFKVQGYKGKRLPLWWRLINERTGAQAAQSRDLFIVPAAATDQNTNYVMITWSRSPGFVLKQFVG
jgi:hypothetical protein